MHVRTLEAKRAVYGPDHPEVRATMAALAWVYSAQERHEEAAALLTEAIERADATGAGDSPTTLTMRANYAVTLLHLERYDEAERASRAVLQARTDREGPGHPATLVARANLGGVYVKMERWDEAETLYGEAIAGLRTALPGHWYLGVFLHDYGFIKLNQAAYPASEEALLEAHGILAGNLGDGHDRTTKAIETLVELYDAWERPGDAERWRGRLQN